MLVAGLNANPYVTERKEILQTVQTTLNALSTPKRKDDEKSRSAER